MSSFISKLQKRLAQGGVGLHAHRASHRARDHRHPARDRGPVVYLGFKTRAEKSAAQANVRAAIPAAEAILCRPRRLRVQPEPD